MFLPGILFFSGRSRALLAVSWLGGFVFFAAVCLFYAAVCALCAWFCWFPSPVYHFIVVWRLPALCLLCAAVSALWPVVFDGGLFFFRQFFFIVDVRFYIFSVVECCFLVIFVFTFPHYKLGFSSACRLVLRWYVSFMPLIAHFVWFFNVFFVRFVCYLPFFALSAEFCVSFLMFFFVVGLFFLRQFFFIVDVRFYIFFLSLNVVCCVLFVQHFRIINWSSFGLSVCFT